MPHELMTNCEQKKRFMLKREMEWLWIKIPVSLVGTSYEAIRCMYCHGAVRIRRRSVDHGSEDHVEHLSRQDAENCQDDNTYVQGKHRLSSQPVE